jgi:anti-sigma regulatory factor (Ser/Thr protein kinase)
LESRRDIPTGPQAAAEARRFVVDSLGDQLTEKILTDLRLVTSELVANSVQHADNPPGHPIQVTLDLRSDRLRLEVVDRSVFDPTPETASESKDVKFGLTIVDRIAEDWGRIDPPEGGIWVEFRLPHRR